MIGILWLAVSQSLAELLELNRSFLVRSGWCTAV